MIQEKTKNKINKIYKNILNVLLAFVSIILIIFVYYFFQIKILNNEYANLFGYTFFEVATGSMSPTINVGDVVIIKITKEVYEDDIIVYKEDENFITHRLISKKENTLITKGDANNIEDNPIEEADVLGKVVNIIPHIGILRKAILSLEVIGLIVVLIIILIVSLLYTSKEEKLWRKKF